VGEAKVVHQVTRLVIDHPDVVDPICVKGLGKQWQTGKDGTEYAEYSKHVSLRIRAV
jgi:hypothetical protein